MGEDKSTMEQGVKTSCDEMTKASLNFREKLHLACMALFWTGQTGTWK